MQQCLADVLAVAVKNLEGGAGHAGFLVIFRNRGAVSCTLQGYPSVRGVRDGAVVVTARHTKSGYFTTKPGGGLVVLKEGEYASAVLEAYLGANSQMGPCPKFDSWSIAPRESAKHRLRDAPPDLCYPEVHQLSKGDASQR